MQWCERVSGDAQTRMMQNGGVKNIAVLFSTTGSDKDYTECAKIEHIWVDPPLE